MWRIRTNSEVLRYINFIVAVYYIFNYVRSRSTKEKGSYMLITFACAKAQGYLHWNVVFLLLLENVRIDFLNWKQSRAQPFAFLFSWVEFFEFVLNTKCLIDLRFGRFDVVDIDQIWLRCEPMLIWITYLPWKCKNWCFHFKTNRG